MAAINYQFIPSLAQFKRDSNVFLAIRSKDIILAHMDSLLQQLETRMHLPEVWKAMVCDLFMSANLWIKLLKEKNRNIDPGRYQAVLALFEAAMKTLCRELCCDRKLLTKTLQEIFGREMDDQGKNIDNSNGLAIYWNDITRELFRVRFNAGRAYHYRIDQPARPVLTPINSEKLYSKANRPGGGESLPNFAPFVMTMDRAFYMGKHRLGDKTQRGIYHSAYTKGGVIGAAGTMLIENGTIKAIRADSGHYKPDLHNTYGAILALRMYAVPLRQIKVLPFNYTNEGFRSDSQLITADEFLIRNRRILPKIGEKWLEEQAWIAMPVVEKEVDPNDPYKD